MVGSRQGWGVITAGALFLVLAACSTQTAPPPGGGTGLSISGTVTAPAGGDVANTVVVACFANDCNDNRSKSVTLTQSGNSGNFQISGLAAGSYGVIAVKDVSGTGTIDDGDYASNVQDVTPPATDVVLTMQVRGGGGGGSDDGRCANTLTENLTVSGVFVNTPSDCDYLVTRPISLSNGQFTIEPGVLIKFEQDTYLRVDDNASLDAVGTAAAPIRFEASSPVKGFAKGLNIGSGSLVTRLEHVHFTNLGKEDRGAFGGLQNGAIDGLNGGGLIMKNVTVRGSIYDGVKLDRLPILEFENNTFADNARYPVRINAGQLHKLDAASDYLGGSTPNGRPYIYVLGVGSNAAVYESATWKKLDAPYFVNNAVWIDGGTITLEPGVTFVFADDAGFRVSGPGALTAIGTADAPIVFTGERQVPGYWNGIRLTDSSQNNFEHVEVRYGGGGIIYNANITLTVGSPYLSLKNSLVADSSTFGICVLSGEVEWDAATEFRNNPLGDVENRDGGC